MTILYFLMQDEGRSERLNKFQEGLIDVVERYGLVSFSLFSLLVRTYFYNIQLIIIDVFTAPNARLLNWIIIKDIKGLLLICIYL